MKIAHVIDYFQPHLGYQESYLASEHQKAGHEVHVVTSDRLMLTARTIDAVRQPLHQIDQQYEFIIHRLKIFFEYRTRTWLFGLEKTLFEINPDLIIMHGVSSITALRVAILKKRLGNAKLIVDCHSNYVNSRHPLRKLFYGLYRRFILSIIRSNADAVIAVDANSKQFLIDECGFASKNITIIPLGADLHLFSPDELARRTIRENYGIATTDVVLVFAGKMSRVKDIGLFIDASLTVMQQASNIWVLAIGDGDRDYIGEMKSKVRQSSFEDKFIWTGFLSKKELAKYYCASDIAVWPKQVSIGTLEAQACRLPLVAADTPMLKDRIFDDTGLIFESGSVDSLVEKLESLVSDKDRRTRMGQAARAKIDDKFNWQNIAQSFLDCVG